VSKKAPKYVTVKPSVKTSKWSPSEEILDESFLAKALFKALKDEDVDSFKEILFAHLDAKVKSKVAKKMGLAHRTMYEALSEKGNPSLKTIAKIVRMACAA
jgi:probable addiction module antidote protein